MFWMLEAREAEPTGNEPGAFWTDSARVAASVCGRPAIRVSARVAASDCGRPSRITLASVNDSDLGSPSALWIASASVRVSPKAFPASEVKDSLTLADSD